MPTILPRLRSYLDADPTLTPVTSKQYWFVVFCIGILTLAVTVGFWNFGIDDGFIGYRIAENIAGGNGWVYNPGERTNGATSPLWTFVLIAGALAGFVNVTSHLVSAFCLFAAGVFVWRFSTPIFGWRLALITSGLLLTHLLLLLSIGMETALYLAFAFASFLAWQQRRPLVLGLALAGTLLARPDGVVLAGILFLLVWIRERALPWRSVLVFLIPLLAWSAFSIWYFGTPFPNTLAAKMAQARSGFWSLSLGPLSRLPLFFKGALYWLKHFHQPLTLILAFPCSLVGLLSFRKWPISLAVPLGWGAAHLAAYSILKVPHYHWYYSPVLAAFVLLSVYGFKQILNKSAERSRGLGTIVALLGIVIVFQQIQQAYDVSRGLPEPRELAYHAMGSWIATHTRPDASVAAAEIGIIGYYAQRRIVDMAALIHQEGPEELRRGNASWWLARYRPDIVLAHSPIWPIEAPIENSPDYRVVRRFSYPFYGEITVYERRDSGAVR